MAGRTKKEEPGEEGGALIKTPPQKKTRVVKASVKGKTAKTTKAVPTKRRKKSGSADEVFARVQDVLLDVMSSAESSDAARVSAAKALMDKIKGRDSKDDEEKRHEEEERLAAVFEIRALLAELALAHCGGDALQAAVDQGSAAPPTDAAG